MVKIKWKLSNLCLGYWSMKNIFKKLSQLQVEWHVILGALFAKQQLKHATTPANYLLIVQQPLLCIVANNYLSHRTFGNVRYPPSNIKSQPYTTQRVNNWLILLQAMLTCYNQQSMIIMFQNVPVYSRTVFLSKKDRNWDSCVNSKTGL